MDFSPDFPRSTTTGEYKSRQKGCQEPMPKRLDKQIILYYAVIIMRKKEQGKTPMVPIMVRLPREIVDEIREIAEKELRPFSSVIRRALIEWLRAKDKKR